MNNSCAVVMIKSDDKFYMLGNKDGITSRDSAQELREHFLAVVNKWMSHETASHTTSKVIMQTLLAPRIVELTLDQLDDGLISDAWTRACELESGAFRTTGVLLNGDMQKIEALYQSWSYISESLDS